MNEKMEKIFGWGLAVIIIATVSGALMMVGGPSKARDEKIDATRLSNMQQTARVISCYADDINDVPKSIQLAKTALEERSITPTANDKGRRRCRNLRWKTDPVTQEDFEYKRLSQKSFELCAVFLRKGSYQTRQASYNYNSNSAVLITDKQRESAGRHCYKAKNWS